MPLYRTQLIPGPPSPAGGRYDSTFWFGGQTGTIVLSANALFAVEMILVHPTRVAGAPISLDRIGIEVTAAATTGSKARVGLHQMGSDGKPGALIVDGGEVAIDAIAGVENTISATVYSGVPFFATLETNATTTVRGYATMGNRAGLSSLTDINNRLGWTRSFAYAALPDPFGTPSLSAFMPRVIVRTV